MPRYRDVADARRNLWGSVMVWYEAAVCGHPRDRYWLAEYNGTVLDYGDKDSLVEDAIRSGYSSVVVLTWHRAGDVTAREVYRDPDAGSGHIIVT